MQTFLRRLEILNYLNVRKSSLKPAADTESIVEHLCDAGYLDMHSEKRRSQFRVVQRDLQFLLGEEFEGEYENEFGLVMTRGQGKSLLWSLDPFQQIHYDFERMPAYMALALRVSQKHLSQALPSQTRQDLAHVFSGAQEKLQQMDRKLSQKHYHRLTEAVEFYQRGQSLQAPDFDPEILDRIYQGILLGKRLEFRYASGSGSKSYTIHPYGVAIMLPKLYLIGVKHEDIGKGEEDLSRFRRFLVHRIEDISLSMLDNQVPGDFDLREFLEEGHMDVLIDPSDTQLETLEVSLYPVSSSNLLQELRDSPLSADQTISQDGERWVLRASVRRTIQLRNWLLSLGTQARVLAPTSVRDDLLAHIEALQSHYELPDHHN